jgi:hypothetical protein
MLDHAFDVSDSASQPHGQHCLLVWVALRTKTPNVDDPNLLQAFWLVFLHQFRAALFRLSLPLPSMALKHNQPVFGWDGLCAMLFLEFCDFGSQSSHVNASSIDSASSLKECPGFSISVRTFYMFLLSLCCRSNASIRLSKSPPSMARRRMFEI